MHPVNRKGSYMLQLEDLPQDCIETDILKLMQPYGKVNTVTIHRHHSGGHQTPYTGVSASAEFQLREHAESVMHYLENNLVWGKKLKVQLVLPIAASAGALVNNGLNPKPMRSAQVHISYLSKQLNAMVSEQMIYELFSTFGKVLEVSLKKKCVDTEMCIQNGYGFVHFPLTSEGIDSALQAVESLHQVTINHVSYDCSVSNQLRQVLLNTGRLLKKSQHGASQPNLLVNTASQSSSPRFQMTTTGTSGITNNQQRFNGAHQAASATQSDSPVNSLIALQQLQQQVLLQNQSLPLPLKQVASWSEGQFSAEISLPRSQRPSSVHSNQNFQAPAGANAHVMNGMVPKPSIAPNSHMHQMHSQPVRNAPDVPVSPAAVAMPPNIPVGFAKDRESISSNNSCTSSRSRSFYGQGMDGSALDDMTTPVGTLSLSTSMDYWGDAKSIANSSHSSISSFLPGGSFYLGDQNSHNASFSDWSTCSSHNSSTSNLNPNTVNNMRTGSALAAMSGSAMGIAHPIAHNANRTNLVPGRSMSFHQTPPLPHQHGQQLPQQNHTLQPLQRPVPSVSMDSKGVSPITAASSLQGHQQFQQPIHSHLPPPPPKSWLENNPSASVTPSYVAPHGLNSTVYSASEVVSSGRIVSQGSSSMVASFPTNYAPTPNASRSFLSSMGQGGTRGIDALSQGTSLDDLFILPSDGLLSSLSSPQVIASNQSTESAYSSNLLRTNAPIPFYSLEESPAWH